MNVTETRELVDGRLRAGGYRRTSDSEWEAVLADQSLLARYEYSGTPEEDLAADAVPFILGLRHAAGGPRREMPHRTATKRIDPLSPPDWWEAESQCRLYAARKERAALRLEAGLLDQLPLGSVAEIAPLVESLARRQREWFFTEHPSEQSKFKRQSEWLSAFHAQHGYGDVKTDYSSRGHWDEIEYPSESWEQDEEYEILTYPPRAILTFSKEASPNLDRLNRDSRRVARTLGIEQADCLVWSLTDYPVSIPWMPVSRDAHWTPDGEWTIVRVQVNSVSATAQAVARAYTLARRDLDDEKTAQRAPMPWPALVVAFVQQRQKDVPAETWQERFDAFKETHPDHPYKTVRTFAEAYRQRVKGAKP